MQPSLKCKRLLSLSSAWSLRPKELTDNGKVSFLELLQIMCGVTDDDLEPQADKQHGTIDGIEINMQHPLLNPTEWQPELFPAPASPGQSIGRTEAGPFIWFPWFGRFSASGLERTAKKMFSIKSNIRRSRERNASIVDPKFDEYVRFNTPECIVCVGDKICIDEVEKGHNPEMRYARLRVERVERRGSNITHSTEI